MQRSDLISCCRKVALAAVFRLDTPHVHSRREKCCVRYEVSTVKIYMIFNYTEGWNPYLRVNYNMTFSKRQNYGNIKTEHQGF